MKLPYRININSGIDAMHNWQSRFKDDLFPRHIREVVWRRHQCESNRHESGWQSPDDWRKRIIHVRDVYDFADGFYLNKTYLWLHLCLPNQEIREYEEWLIPNLDKLWNKNDVGWKLGDLNCSLHRTDVTLDLNVSSYECPSLQEKMWRVFEFGLRKKRTRTVDPRVLSPSDFLKYAPFNIELGSGPSLEVGIPPLNHFHKLYSIIKDGNFVFNIKDDEFIKRIVTSPEELYFDITRFFKKCIEADTNNSEFYQLVKELRDRNILLEPVFTNNLDGLVRGVGVQEYPLFGFDTIYPKLNFTANTLLVIGSHADRRLVREQAREAGMQIIFVDPQDYNEKQYLIEDIQDSDFIIPMKAAEFAKSIKQQLV